MSHYKRYPKYKDSGAEWIGEVPAHWRVLRLEYIVSTHRENVAPDALNSVNVLHYSIPAVQETGGGNVEAGSTIDSNKLVVRCPQVLISKLNPRKGTVVAAAPNRDLLTVASTEFVPLVPQRGRSVIPFIAAVALSEPLRQLLESRVESVTRSHQRVAPEDILKARVAVPPIDEQAVIAAAIGCETARIDALIAKKTRFIELLKEKRQALITHAVTKGLDPNVKMKDSGVEWIGEVPEHWGTVQLGKVSTSRCDGPFGSGLKSEHYTESGVRVVRLQNIGSAEFNGRDAAFIGEDYWKSQLHGGHEVTAGDVLIAGLGDDNNLLGRACVAPCDLGTAMVKADCYRFRLGPLALPEYVALTLSATARHECGFLATGATRDRLTLTLAAARVIPLPHVEEQRKIVDTIKTQVAKIDRLDTKTEHSVALLKERRSAFITAAVTGQIDLRDAAPSTQRDASCNQ